VNSLIAGFLLAISFGAAHAQDVWPKAAKPEEVGLSSERLARLAKVTQEHVDAGRLPGAVILLARRGKIAYYESFGFRDREKGLPMTRDALFRIYSMTKPITTVAAMMLQEEGRLQVYDPVSKTLPELGHMKVSSEVVVGGKKVWDTVPAAREMTLQDLMRHTSGLTYGTRGQGPVHAGYIDSRIGSRDDTNADLLTKLAKIPLKYQPGTRWEYGVSTDVLGRVVEVVAGKRLGDVFEERIFKPLGMTDTAFHVPADKLSRAAQPWQRPGGPPMTPRFDVGIDAKYQSGGGGLVGSASDYLKFSVMLLNGGKLGNVQLLGKKTVEYMTSDHLGSIPIDAPGLGFGLGFQVRREAGIATLAGSVGEYGWAGNAGTLFWIDPKEQLIAIYMIQVSDPDRVALRNQFRTLVVQSIVE
jgi:CubicO group peptidase (beta-lactamase class C family)